MSESQEAKEAKESVNSAHEAKKKALADLEVEIKAQMEHLPDRMKTFRALDLAHALEELAGMLRAKHFLTHGV